MDKAVTATPSTLDYLMLTNTNWGATLKNSLFGRIENWRENALATCAVYYIAQSAIFLITGYWLYSCIALSTACVCIIIRKDLREIANLRKETSDYQKQNHAHRLINLQQKQITVRLEKNVKNLEKNVIGLEKNIKVFKSEIGRLKVEREKFKKSNATYAHHNSVHEKLIKALSETTDSLATEIRSSLSSNNQINQKILRRFLNASNRLKKQQELLGTVGDQIIQKNYEVLDRYEKLSEQVKKLDLRGLKALQEAEIELAKTNEKILAAAQQLGMIQKQIEQATEINKATAETSKETAELAKSAVRKLVDKTSLFNLSNQINRVVKPVAVP